MEAPMEARRKHHEFPHGITMADPMEALRVHGDFQGASLLLSWGRPWRFHGSTVHPRGLPWRFRCASTWTSMVLPR